MGIAPRPSTIAASFALAALTACSSDAPAPQPTASAQSSAPPRPALEQRFEDYIKLNNAFGEEFDREATSAGASKVYERYQAELRDGYAEIKDAPDKDVTPETRAALATNIAQVTLKVCGKLTTDQAEIAAFDKLCAAYEALFGTAKPRRKLATVTSERGEQLAANVKKYEEEFCACKDSNCFNAVHEKHKAKLNGVGLAPSEIPESVHKSYERVLACEEAVTTKELGR